MTEESPYQLFTMEDPSNALRMTKRSISFKLKYQSLWRFLDQDQ